MEFFLAGFKGSSQSQDFICGIVIRAVIISVLVSGLYRTILRNIGYQVSGIFKVPDIRYCITDSALAEKVKYFHTSMLYHWCNSG